MHSPEFDAFGDDYRSIHTKNLSLTGLDSYHFAEMKANMIAAREEGKQGLHILDAGSGDGVVLHFLAQRMPGCEFIGIDESSVSTAKASGKFPYLRFETGDVQGLHFPDAHFDVILLACVLHHVNPANRELVFKELYRVLKKGGRLYLFEHNPWNPVTRYLVKTCVFDKGVRLIPQKRSLRYLQSQGFSVLHKCFYLLFPGQKNKWLQALERRLGWLPLGGQYLITAVRD